MPSCGKHTAPSVTRVHWSRTLRSGLGSLREFPTPVRIGTRIGEIQFVPQDTCLVCYMRCFYTFLFLFYSFIISSAWLGSSRQRVDLFLFSVKRTRTSSGIHDRRAAYAAILFTDDAVPCAQRVQRVYSLYSHITLWGTPTSLWETLGRLYFQKSLLFAHRKQQQNNSVRLDLQHILPV